VPSGVTPQGFVPLGEEGFANAETADILATIANDLDVSPIVPMGEIIAEDAAHNAEIEALAGTAYNATNPAAAEGALLDNISLLRGIPRQPATRSAVYCSAAFTAAGTYPAGALTGFISSIPSQQASNVSPVVVPSINPVNGQGVSTSNPYVTGSSYAAATQFAAPVTGEIFGAALVAANALNPGEVGAFSGQIPVNGWASVVDISSPYVGTDVETDDVYSARQQSEIGAQGSCTLDAIRVDVIEALAEATLPVIATCQVFENTSDVIDANGLLPHSYSVFVFDGVNPNTQQNDPLIGQAIWNNKPAGVRGYGAINVTVNDAQGVQRTVSFSRPTPVPVFFIVNVTISSNANAAQVTALIVESLTLASQQRPFTAYGAQVQPLATSPTTLLPGVDVVPQAFAGVAQAQAGVVQVTSVLVGFSANPTSSTPLRLSRSQVATIASGSQGTGIVVNVSGFSP
jgi:hypothetical protein